MVSALGEKAPRRDTVASVAARRSLAAKTANRTASAIVEGAAREAMLELERKELAEIEASSRRLAGREAMLELELAEIAEERRAIEELEAREARAEDGGVGSVGSTGRRAEPGGGNQSLMRGQSEPGGGVFARDGEVEELPTTAPPARVQEWPNAPLSKPAPTTAPRTDAQLGGSTEAQLPTMLRGSAEAQLALEMVRDEGAP